MLSKAIVFVFVTLGVFGLLIKFMPYEFTNPLFSPTYMDKKIQETLVAADVEVYDQTGADNMTYPYSSLPDWKLPDGNYVEIWWSDYNVKDLQIRYTWPTWWGYSYDRMSIYSKQGVLLAACETAFQNGITKDILESQWDSEKNMSIFQARDRIHQVSCNFIVLKVNNSATIGENWDQNQLSYILNYNINFTMSGPSAWTLISSLLSFQAINLGIPGVAGTMINWIANGGIFALTAYIIYKILAGLIPFVSGGSGD